MFGLCCVGICRVRLKAQDGDLLFAPNTITRDFLAGFVFSTFTHSTNSHSRVSARNFVVSPDLYGAALLWALC